MNKMLLVSIGVIAITVALYFVLQFKTHLPTDQKKLQQPTALLMNKSDKYVSIINDIQGNKKSITQIISGSFDSDFLYNTLSREFLVKEKLPEEKNTHVMWKIDSQGEVIDKYTTRDSLTPVGIYFEENYYIDWVFSGDKSKQQYERIIDIDTTSDFDYKSLIHKSESSYFVDDYETKVLKYYLKTNNKWSVLSTSRAYEKGIESAFGVKPRREGIFITLKDAISPSYKWQDINSFFEIEQFYPTGTERKSFYDVNNTSRSGTHGTAYYSLVLNHDHFYFKAYAFKSTNSFDPDISLYYPPTIYPDTSSNLVFMILRKRGRSEREYKEVGLYAIHTSSYQVSY